MEKIVKRGYVKWTDEDGVFHKEPLYDHPDMLAEASDEEKARAEVLRDLNAGEPVENAEAPASAAEEVAEDVHTDGTHHDHQKALDELREATS